MPNDALTRLLKQSLPPRPRGARLWVAFSGGLDSTVLLTALVRGRIADVEAVHVHHGLQDSADAWAEHCRTVCESLGVPLHICRVQVQEQGQGPEAAAREARYAALRAHVQPDDVLVTAHHRDDQAETVLLRLLRGTGAAGLAAIRPLSEFGPGWLWRPLLEVSRAQLQGYARRNQLRWIEDPHNQGSRYSRSFLRNEILPRLTRHWPAANRNLARVAELSAETAELLRELAESDLGELAERDGPLPIEPLLQLTPARRRNLVRGWIEGLGLPLPFHDTLLHLDDDVLRADTEADPVLTWPGGEFRRYRDRLFAMAPLPAVSTKYFDHWDFRGELRLPAGCGVLRTRGSGNRRAVPCQVRMARPSDRFRPFGSAHTRTLKNLFQEHGVPTWVRQRTPLVLHEDRIVWVGGIGWASDRDWVVLRNEVEWAERPPGAPPDRTTQRRPVPEPQSALSN